MRVILKWVARTSLALLLLAVIAAAALATTAGQRLLLSAVELAAAADGERVDIGSLEGSLFSTGRIDRIAASDRDGRWLEIRDVRFSWNPFALALGRIDVDRLAIGTISVSRRPRQSLRQEQADAGFDLSIIPIDANKVEVAEILLGDTVLGASANFRLEGAAKTSNVNRGLFARLAVTRTDGAGGDLSAQMSYRPNDGELAIDVSASEPAGGLIAGLTELPGAPPLALKIAGRGPISQWRADWSLAASGQPFIAGKAAIDAAGESHRFQSRFEGYLSPILPRVGKALFEGKTIGTLDGYWSRPGRFDVKAVDVRSDALQLSGSGGFDALRSNVFGSADIRISRGDGASVSFPIPNAGEIVFGNLQASIRLPNQDRPRPVTAEAVISQLATPWGKLGRAEFAAGAQEVAVSGRTGWAFETANVSLALRDVDPKDEALASLIGPSVDIKLTGSGSLATAAIDRIEATTASLSLRGNGGWKRGVADLTADLVASDLGRLSPLIGEDLVGSAKARVTASLPIGTGAIRLAIAASALEAGLAGDGNRSVLKGETTFSASGHFKDPKDWALETVQVSHPKLSLSADGKFQSDTLSARLDASLNDLALASPSLAGALTLKGKVAGRVSDLRSSMIFAGQDVMIAGKSMTGLQVAVNGAGPAADHRGRLELAGAIAGKALNGVGEFAISEGGSFTLDGLNVGFGAARLSGRLESTGGVPLSGLVTFEATDLTEFSGLTDQAISGDLAASAELAGTPQQPRLKFTVKSKRSQFAGLRVGQVSAAADLTNYLTAIEGQADLRIARIERDGLFASDLQARFKPAAQATKFDLEGTVNGARAAASGELAQQGADFSIGLADLLVSKAGTSIKLEAPAKVTIVDGKLELQKVGLSTSGGRAVLEGSLGRKILDLKVSLSRVPAAIADVVRNDLQLGGTIDGTLTAAGSVANPVASVALDWRNATARGGLDAGLPPVAISLKGTLRGDDFENQLTVRSTQGLNLSIAGRGSIEQSEALAQSVTGEVPLQLGNSALAKRGTRLSGKMIVNSKVSGTLERPLFSGTLAISDGAVNDPGSGLKLHSLNGRTRFDGDRVLIDQLRGKSQSGGTVDVTGNVAGLSTGQPESDISLRLREVKFDQSAQHMAGEVDGDLFISGPVAALKASGSLYIKRLDITVPNQLPRSVTALDITHINAPPHLRSADLDDTGANARRMNSDGGVSLGIRIDAAERIFVRGRGLDAQLGGALTISGSSSKPAATGKFALVRGRLLMLGRQLDFKRGTISFNGNLDPYLDLEASAVADDVIATVNIYGILNRLSFRFTSVPDLPEDEVVAKLLFNRSLAKLSPLQIAQLANEVDKIGGLSSGPGILDQLKSSVGVDVLDLGTDKSGSATVSAGSYLDDKTYVGVQQGTGAGSSRVIIDHDLTKTLKAKGEVGADGNSKIGIGVEWNY